MQPLRDCQIYPQLINQKSSLRAVYCKATWYSGGSVWVCVGGEGAGGRVAKQWLTTCSTSRISRPTETGGAERDFSKSHLIYNNMLM